MFGTAIVNLHNKLWNRNFISKTIGAIQTDLFPKISERWHGIILNHSIVSLTAIIHNSWFVHIVLPRYGLIILIAALNTTITTLTNTQLDKINSVEMMCVHLYKRNFTTINHLHVVSLICVAFNENNVEANYQIRGTKLIPSHSPSQLYNLLSGL